MSLSLSEIVLIAVGLAMDAFAVSLGAGTSGLAKGSRAAFRLSFHFGLFQALMPVLGWFIGVTIAPVISAVDHWIAFALLGFVGGKMVRTGFSGDRSSYSRDPSRGLTLVMLSVATSIDALAIGLGLAVLRVRIWYPSAVIGIITALISLVGVRAGTRLGAAVGSRMEVVGGVILLAIGTRLLLQHLLG